jgi:hypothetical protein
MIKNLYAVAVLTAITLVSAAQPLPGFKPSGLFDEQQMVIERPSAGTRVLINAPLSGFETDGPCSAGHLCTSQREYH